MEPKSSLTLALAQMPVETLGIEVNLDYGERLIAQAAEAGAEMVILPEMWTTGFHWPKNSRIAAEHTVIHEQVAKLARKYGVWLFSSLLGTRGGQAANVGLLMSPEGEIVARYDKMHLFSLSGEDRYLVPGQECICANTPWGPIGLVICYDMRFPELWRSLALQGARLILAPAGVPDPRQDHWNTLMRARAIENQCFVAAVNRVGTESIPGGTPQTYFGDSLLVDPWGQLVLEAGHKESVLIAQIDLSESDKTRQRMTVFKDRQPQCYRLD